MNAHDDSILRSALSAHNAGRLTEAEVGYSRVLRKHPTDARALYGLGLLSYHRGAVETAIGYIARCVEHSPGDGRAWNTLGSLYLAAGDAERGRKAYQRATEVAPEMSEGWYNLGICLQREGDFDAAVEKLREATRCRPPYGQAHDALASLLYQRDRTVEASEVLAEWAVRDPANPKASHMAAAASGRNVPIRASDGYVMAHFDAAASGFDRNLRELDYCAPELVAAALSRSFPERFGAGATSGSTSDSTSFPAATAVVFAEVLDAGCGTGLCGPLIRSMCRRLVGVDLSPGMLAHARSRGCYDELVTAELTEFMRNRPQSFDAIVSADTLVYFGALEQPLSAASQALCRAGTLVFTVEALSDRESRDHRLQLSGRFAHSEAYLRRALTVAGLELQGISRQKLREERSQSVDGFLVVARRP